MSGKDPSKSHAPVRERSQPSRPVVSVNEPTVSEPLDPLVGQQIERYSILARIAKGGTATVYRALDNVLNRDVAVKILHEHLETKADIVERFKKEAQLIAQLRHPNVVNVFDFLEHRGRAVVVVEYMPGATLSQFIQAPYKIPEDYILMMGLEILHGLQAAHERGITHRDIKPANILINSEMGVKISDFGLAKLVHSDDGLTKEGIFVGTPSFSSPEQIEGRALDQRSDLFSLGLTLYMLATKAHAFKEQGDSTTTVWFKIVKGRFESVRNRDPNLSPELERVMNKALEVDLQKRYQSAGEMIQDLEEILKRRGLMPYQKHLASFLKNPAEAPPLSVYKESNFGKWKLPLVGGALLAGATLGLWFFLNRSQPAETTESAQVEPPKVEDVSKTSETPPSDPVTEAKPPEEKPIEPPVEVPRAPDATPRMRTPQLETPPQLPLAFPVKSKALIILNSERDFPGVRIAWKGAGRFVLARDQGLQSVEVSGNYNKNLIDLGRLRFGTYFWKGGDERGEFEIQELQDYRARSIPRKRALPIVAEAGDYDLVLNPWTQELMFSWNLGPQASAYRIELAAGPQFQTLIYSGVVATKSATVARLWDKDQTVFWRVNYLDENRNIFLQDPPKKINLTIRGDAPYVDIVSPEPEDRISGSSVLVRAVAPSAAKVRCRLIERGAASEKFVALQRSGLYMTGEIPVQSRAEALLCESGSTYFVTALR